jgi:predicted nucleotidyltransferase
LHEHFARHPEVAAVYLFGSVAAGRARADSDIDIGIVYERSRSPGVHERVVRDLTTRIAVSTGFERVDIVDLEAQGPIFCHNVLSTGGCVYEGDRERRIDFESDTIVRAIDFRPTYELATRGKVAALRRWLRERYDLRGRTEQARHPESEPRQAR